MDEQRHSPAPAGPLPSGARLLSADEAIDTLAAGDHPDTSGGSIALDVALIDLLRAGRIIACRLSDGRVAFTRVLPDGSA
jgi:hypothetical protein